MTRLFVATAAALALSASGAIAADLARPVPAPAPYYKAPPVAVSSWTGCYIGGNVGGILENDKTNITLFDPTGSATPAFAAGAIPSAFSYDRSGVIGGAQLGCNWQMSNWVFGVETDFDGTSLSGGQTINTAVPTFFPATSTVTQKMDWLGTTRARLGIAAWNNVLVYGTGGVAYAGVNDSYLLSNTAGGGPVSTFASDSSTLFGWTAGGGLEYGFGQWSVKAEALYYDLGNHSLAAPCTVVGGAACAAPNTVFTAHYQNQGVIARIGLNYHFNFGGPIAAGY